MMAGSIGNLSASRVRASDEPFWPVHGVVYALDLRDGSERWRTETDSVYGQPIVTDEAVYTASHTSVRALDRERGQTQWELDEGMPRRQLFASTQPGFTETEERVYINTGTLEVARRDDVIEAVENEEVVWSFKARDIKQIDYDERTLRERTWKVHEPVVDGDTVFIGAVQLDRASIPRSEVHDTGLEGNTGSGENGGGSLAGVGLVLTAIGGIGVIAGRVLSSDDK